MKILFVLKTSNYRTTGFYNINDSITRSSYIRNEFDSEYITLKAADKSRVKLIYFVDTFITSTRNCFKIFFNLLKFNPDVVYFTISPVNSFIRDLAYIVIFKCFRKKLVYHLHGKGIKEKCQKTPLMKVLYRYAYKNTGVICLSKTLSSDISEIYSHTPYVVNNGIEKCIDDKKIKYVKNNTNLKIAYLSNFIKTKGIFDYIDALHLLYCRNISFEGIIVGEEDEITKVELQNYIESKNLQSHITIKGPKYGKEKYEELLNADIFIFPTYYEAFGLVILEAMQCGLPVISTNEGSIPEIIDNGKQGFLVEKNNPFQLYEKIKCLAENPQLRMNMGKAGREKFLKCYTFEVFEKKLTDVLKSV